MNKIKNDKKKPFTCLIINKMPYFVENSSCSGKFFESSLTRCFQFRLGSSKVPENLTQFSSFHVHEKSLPLTVQTSFLTPRMWLKCISNLTVER